MCEFRERYRGFEQPSNRAQRWCALSESRIQPAGFWLETRRLSERCPDDWWCCGYETGDRACDNPPIEQNWTMPAMRSARKPLLHSDLAAPKTSRFSYCPTD